MDAKCSHKIGDYIHEMGFWLCSNCFARLESRPSKYGPPKTEGRGPDQPPQMILWQAEIAKANCGATLAHFLRIMVKRIMTRTRPRMDKSDAYDAAIEMLRDWPDKFGHPDYCWSDIAARELVDEEMQHWDLAEVNT